jgi:hypothetical protein
LEPKLVTIDEEANHQIVHAFRLRKTGCATHQTLDPGPEIDVVTLNFLCILLPHVMRLCIEMPLVGASPVRVKLHDAKGLQESFEAQEHRGLPSAENVGQHGPALMIDGMP